MGIRRPKPSGSPSGSWSHPICLDEIPQILARLQRGSASTIMRRSGAQGRDAPRRLTHHLAHPGQHGPGHRRLQDRAGHHRRKRADAALQQAHATLEQRVQERTALLALIQDVTRAANEAPRSAVALQYALDRFCAYTGWPVGHVYLAVAPGADRWAPTALWHLDAPERFTAFQQATQALEFAAGEGLIGRVGARGQPEWQRDVATDPDLSPPARGPGSRAPTGVAWPLLVGQEVAGVLEFYTPRRWRRTRPCWRP